MITDADVADLNERIKAARNWGVGGVAAQEGGCTYNGDINHEECVPEGFDVPFGMRR